MKKILLIALLISSISSFAQVGGATSINDPISSSMGNTSVSNSRGAYAIYRNPANLAFSDSGSIEATFFFALPNIALSAENSIMTLENYNYYFGGVEVEGETQGRYLTESDKADLISLFEDGGNLSMQTSYKYLTAVYAPNKKIGTFGFSISDQISGVFSFPKGAVDLVLNGNVVSKYYDFNDANADFNYLRDYSLSYARDFSDLIKTPLEHINVGISLKYVQGFATFHTQEVSSSIVTNEDNSIDIDGHFVAQSAYSSDLGFTYDFDSTQTSSESIINSPFFSPAGSGFGLDFGASAQWKYLTVGFSITNIGSVTWTENAAQFNSDVAFVIEDITDEEMLDSLADMAKSEGKYISSFTTDLPTSLRFGASLQVDELVANFPGKMVIATDIIQGFNRKSTNSESLGMGIGIEWRPFQTWPIMTGLAFGNDRPSVAWTFGTGFDTGVFEMLFALNNFNDILNVNQAQILSFNFGTRWKFNK